MRMATESGENAFHLAPAPSSSSSPHTLFCQRDDNDNNNGNVDDEDCNLEEYNDNEDDVEGDGRGDERDGGGDRAPLLTADGNANSDTNSRAERKAGRARKRWALCVESQLALGC